MKLFLFLRISIILEVLLYSLSSAAQSNLVGGKWKIDTVQTDYGGLLKDIAIANYLEVTSSSDSIFIIRKYPGGDYSRQAIPLNGTKIKRITEDGNQLYTSQLVNLKHDGFSILWHFEIGDNELIYDRTEVWEFSNQNSRLVIDRITTLPDKVDKVKGVYNKIITK